jgi:hypothetical protein
MTKEDNRVNMAETRVAPARDRLPRNPHALKGGDEAVLGHHPEGDEYRKDAK